MAFPISIPERETQVAKLMDSIGAVADGTEISWLKLEHDTAIKMDMHGRALVRIALRKLRRPYEAVRGVGIRVSSHDTAMSIMGQRFIRIDNSVRRADRTREQLSDRHLAQMSTQDQQRMLTLAGFFGTVRAFAKEASSRILGR